MRNNDWVCVEHRVAVRSHPYHAAPPRCPVDGEPLANLGYRWRIPKKSDDDGWEGVVEELQRRELARRRTWHGGWWKADRAMRLLDKWSPSD